MTNAPIITPTGKKNVVFVIMAAGEGKRMNSNVPKVLHEHDGVPMLVKIIRTTQELAPKKLLLSQEDIINSFKKHVYSR